MSSDEINLTKANDEAYQHLLRVLERKFGEVLIRQLNINDMMDLEDVLAAHAANVRHEVSSYYVDQLVKQTNLSTMNMLRGVLAGQVVEGRRHGVEPDPEVVALITGAEPPESP